MIYSNHTWRQAKSLGTPGNYTLVDYGKFGVKSKRSYPAEVWNPSPLYYENSAVHCDQEILWRPAVGSPFTGAPDNIGQRMRNGSLINSSGSPSGEFSRVTYARAMNKLVEKMYGPSSELGTSIAEGREALVAIATRAAQLGNSYRALKRGDFRGFIRHLACRPKRQHEKTVWTRPKDASSLWLEYWFGWAPLIGDLSAAATVLSDPLMIPPLRLQAWSGLKVDVSDGSTNTTWQADIRSGMIDHMLGVGCQAQVTNPNAYLAQRIGLTNPAGIAWNVIPFSWFAGWFGNFDQFIQSWTGSSFNGVTLSACWVTSRSRLVGCQEYHRSQTVSHPNRAVWINHLTGMYMVRRPVSVFPGVPLIIKGPKLSKSRAATAISLLVSIFTKG